MSKVQSERQRLDRRSSWIMLLCGLPLALIGLAMIIIEPFLNQSWLLGLLSLLLFGSCAAMGVHGLIDRPAPVPVVDPTRNYRVRLDSRRLALFSGLSLVFTAMSVFILATVPLLSITGLLGGALGLAFFGPGAVMLAWKAWRGRSLALEIGPEGIRDWRAGGVLLPWSAIRSIWEARIFDQSILCCDIPDLKTRVPDMPRLWRASAALSESLGYAPWSISANGLDVPAPTLRAIIRTHATAHGIPLAIGDE